MKVAQDKACAEEQARHLSKQSLTWQAYGKVAPEPPESTPLRKRLLHLISARRTLNFLLKIEKSGNSFF